MLEEEKLKEETDKMIKWVTDFVKANGAKGVVVGLSGGKDSATVTAIAVKALGKENVVTVGMPCSSISADLEDATLVAKTFDVPLLKVDLTSEAENLTSKISNQLGKLELAKEVSKEGKINTKPRLRMATLYAVAQSLNYLVIGTGNLSEGVVGYTTKWGDNACDFAPIANFTVEEVRKIGENLGVPKQIVVKDPNDGLGGQTDEEKMGIKYSQISEYIETGKTDEDAMRKIEKMHEISNHKRAPIPAYYFERTNYLK